MTIVLAKLASGEELIGELIPMQNGTGEDSVGLKNPCRVVTIDQGDGNFTAQFQPIAVFYQEATLMLSNNALLWTGLPTEGFQEAYTSKFTDQSAILTPPEQKIFLG